MAVDPGLDLVVDGELRLTCPPNGGGTAGSYIRNRDLRTRTTARITGEGTIGTIDHTRTANLFALYGDDVHLTDFTVDCWAGGRTMIIAGDRMRLDDFTVTGGLPETNNGGIRFVGGKNFRARNLHVESGDDVFQFVPAGNPNDPFYDMSIEDAYYIGCTGLSHSAKLMVAGLQSSEWSKGNREATMTASITDVGWLDVTGQGGCWAAALQNLSSSGTISGVRYSRSGADMGASTGKVLAAEIQINAEAYTGGIEDVRGDLYVANPRTDLMRVSRNVRDLELRVAEA